MKSAVAQPALLVLASTYPRWAGDHEPGFVHELARRLVNKFDVHVVTPSSPGALAEELLDRVHIHRYRYAPRALETLVHGGGIVTHLKRAPWKLLLVPGFILGQWLAARRIVRVTGTTVIHAHWLLPQGVVARLLGRPYLVTSHGADLFALSGACFTRLRRWVLAQARGVTVVSAAMRRRVLDEAPVTAVQVLPMGVDARERFYPDPTVPREPGQLLFVGRLVEKKGLRHLIEAMPAIVAAHPQVRLCIVGSGPDETALRGRVEALELASRVSFEGSVGQADLPTWYRQASAFVAPFVQASNGDQEGLGLVVAEAMACGCPVLVGDVAAVHDLVDERLGVIVPASDHSRLATAVIGMLDDPAGAAKRAQRGREHVLARFDWDAIAASYARVLDKCRL